MNLTQKLLDKSPQWTYSKNMTNLANMMNTGTKTIFGTINTCARGLGGSADHPVTVRVEITLSFGRAHVVTAQALPVKFELVCGDALQRKIALDLLRDGSDNSDVCAALMVQGWRVI